jgi:hypothetical protein
MNINKNLCNIINEYVHMDEYVFRYPNINMDEYLWSISKNPLAGEYIRTLNKLPWKSVSMNLSWICSNESCVDFLYEFPMQKEDLECIASNPLAMHLIEEFKFLQDTTNIFYNTYGSKYYLHRDKNNDVKTYTKIICANTDNIEFVDEYIQSSLNELIYWDYLSMNPKFTNYMLQNHKEKINWGRFCMNESKEAIEYLTKNPEYIIWDSLSMNSHAIELLRKNINKIRWTLFLYNHRFYEIIHDIEIYKSHISITVLNEPPIIVSRDHILYSLYHNPSLFKRV